MTIYQYSTRAKTSRTSEKSDVIMTFDSARAEEVLTVAVGAYRARSHVFAYDSLFPEATKPPIIKPKSPEHIMWHLLGVFFDHTLVSAYMYRDLYFLVMDNPELLSINGILQHNEDSLESLLRTKMAHPDSRRESTFLLEAMSDFRKNYGSDASNILEGTSDLTVVRNRLLGLKNIREKKANLFLLYMIKYGLKEFANPEKLELAIDFHKIRITYATGIINFNVPSITGQVARRLARIAYSDFIANHPNLPFTPVDIDDVLWVIPSKVCSKDAAPTQKEQKWLRCLTQCPFARKYCNGVIVRNDYKGYFDFTKSLKPPNPRQLEMNILPITREEILSKPERARYCENISFVRQDYAKENKRQASFFE